MRNPFTVIRIPQYLTLSACTAAVLAGVLAPAVASAEGVAGQEVAIRFIDRCDGGTDVEAPNPFSGRNLVFTINEAVIVVGPGQRHVEHVPAPAGDGDLVVNVEVHDRDDAVAKTLHDWSRPKTCEAADDADAGHDAAADAGHDAAADAGHDAAADAGYGAADGTAAAITGVAGAVGPASDGLGTAMSADDVARADSAAATEPDSAAAGLPVTGADVIGLASLGVTLVAGGLALVLIRRRRIRFDAS
ncbi:LPXTG cell wall anchor domain-containing protein [Dactylosporangium sp. CS-047395]|uniref:LPXTG cell wall anchor domain-containing protein n=1 Tax=Dactylosporangium sp. CS-047395 TaxID=3239936 RepID=UPI003D8A51C1